MDMDEHTDKLSPAKESRPPFNGYMMEICHVVARRATCRHRDQGAVIVKDKRILATGYNGAPPKVKDCLEHGYCFKIETSICRAEGLHGESNAIISAAKMGTSVDGADIYCVYSPCRACCNMLKAAGIRSVYYEHLYDGFPDGPNYLKVLGVSAIRVEPWGEGNE